MISESADIVQNKVVLEQLKFYAVSMIRQKGLTLNNIKLDINDEYSFMAGDLAMTLSAMVMGEKQTVQLEKVPLNWWEHLKERWYPNWAIDRWPVKTRSIMVDTQVLYPYLNVSLPNEDSVILFNTYMNKGDLE